MTVALLEGNSAAKKLRNVKEAKRAIGRGCVAEACPLLGEICRQLTNQRPLSRRLHNPIFRKRPSVVPVAGRRFIIRAADRPRVDSLIAFANDQRNAKFGGSIPDCLFSGAEELCKSLEADGGDRLLADQRIVQRREILFFNGRHSSLA